jgi:hypothetical protein
MSFQADVVLGRRRQFASLSGASSGYSTAPDGDCSNLPFRDLSVSLWVRVDGTQTGANGVQRTRSGFIGCFKSGAGGVDGWLLGTTVEGRAFAFVLRSQGAAAATMISDMSSEIELGTWYVCIFFGLFCAISRLVIDTHETP